MLRGMLLLVGFMLINAPSSISGADEPPVAPLPSPPDAEIDVLPATAEPLLLPQSRREACLPTPRHITYGGTSCQHPCCLFYRYPCGCKPPWKARHQAKCWGYPEEFCERPFGTFARVAWDGQIANGLQDQQTLYRFDFRRGQLSPRGELQLHKIAQRMQHLAGPVWIEATRNDELNQHRQLAVIEQLNRLGIPADQDLVLVLPMIRPGLSGLEAVEIFNNQLQQTTEMGGTAIGTMGGDSGGAEPTAIPPFGQ